MTRHLSDYLPPPLSSESRPEGHPLEGLQVNNTAVGRTNIKLPLPKASYQPYRCTPVRNQSSPFHGHRINHPAVKRKKAKSKTLKKMHNYPSPPKKIRKNKKKKPLPPLTNRKMRIIIHTSQIQKRRNSHAFHRIRSRILLLLLLYLYQIK